MVHVHFRGQRFCSQPVPCACEPNFNEAFVLELHKETSGTYIVLSNFTYSALSLTSERPSSQLKETTPAIFEGFFGARFGSYQINLENGHAYFLYYELS